VIGSGRRTRADPAIAVMAARRYFLDGATKSEIAAELGVSRFRVARLLESARRHGIVRIEIDAAPGIDATISHELAAAYGIRSAIVVRTVPGPPGSARALLGAAAAGLVAETVEATDVLGISWGRTLQAMVQQLAALPECTVVQLVGSIPAADLDMNALELVRRMTVRGAGAVFPLHVPLIVDTPETATRLRTDAHAAATFAAFARVTRAIVGIGAWTAGESTLRSAVSAADAATIDAAGAVADVCSILLDAQGSEIRAAGLPDRCLAIRADELRTVPDVLAVAEGPAKAAAIGAVLRSGLVHRLVTTEETGRLLLERAAHP
jgi:DNA-binding transcriptional regulator LsrR (DeoR family)